MPLCEMQALQSHRRRADSRAALQSPVHWYQICSHSLHGELLSEIAADASSFSDTGLLVSFPAPL